MLKRFFGWLASLLTPKPSPPQAGPADYPKKPEEAVPSLPAGNAPVSQVELCKRFHDVASREIGVKEVIGTKHNPRVLEYHAATSLKAKDDETAWCAAFVNWVMKQCGVKGTGTAWARDFEEWGVPVSKPFVGCVVGFERNAPGGDSHVAFYVGEEGSNYLVLGGNQGNMVCIKAYPKRDLIYIRAPKVSA